MTSGRGLRLIIGLSVAVFFLWLLLRRVRFDEISRAFRGIDILCIGMALVAFFMGYACRIQRWRLMLKHSNPELKWSTCAGPFFGGYAMNNVLPLRAGDVMRCFAFNRTLGATPGSVVASLFLERLLDLLMVLGVLAVTLTLFNVSGSSLASISSGLIAALVALLTSLIFFPLLFSPIALFFIRLTDRISPTLAHKLKTETERGFVMLQYSAERPTILRLLFWSLIAWLFEGCVYLFAALAVPTIGKPFASWFALPVATLATLLPGTPGYVGTFHYFASHAMTEHGNAGAAGAAYALLTHMLLWLPSTLLGGLYILIHSAKQTAARVT